MGTEPDNDPPSGSKTGFGLTNINLFVDETKILRKDSFDVSSTR